MIVRLGQQASRAFRPKDWSDIRRDLGQMTKANPGSNYLIDIIDSVIASGLADSLAATTSMHDLIVAARPVMDPPFRRHRSACARIATTSTRRSGAD